MAVLAAFLGIHLTQLLKPYLSISPPLLLCFLAVMCTAWYGGFRAALVTIGLSTFLFDYYFIDPEASLTASPTDLAALALFILEATLVAYFIDYLKCSRGEAITTKERLKRLYGHSSLLLEGQAINPMAAQVLDASLDLLQAEKGLIQLRQPQGEVRLMHLVGLDDDQEALQGLSLLASEAYTLKRRVCVDSTGLNNNFSPLATLFHRHPIGAAQSTPLIDADGHCFGVASTFTCSRTYFVETDLGVLDLYIQQAQRILATKLHEEQLRTWNEELEHEVSDKQEKLIDKEKRILLLTSDLALTEQRERRQLASELHDYLCQLLALALMKISQARKSVPPASSECVLYLQETDRVLRRSMSYARSLMAELYPPALHDSGLPAALRWLAEQMSFHDLAVDLKLSSDSFTLSEDQAIVLYRAVRELLINVSKHARVDRALLSMSIDTQNTLCITVQDGGRGFDTLSPKVRTPGSNYGLASVSERLAALGGWLKAESTVGQGSTMKVCLPLNGVSSHTVRAASSVHSDHI